jgi:hypothetical protein
MQMEFLRCKTPEMVHKEIWAHLLAYNLLRTEDASIGQQNMASLPTGCRTTSTRPGTPRLRPL